MVLCVFENFFFGASMRRKYRKSAFGVDPLTDDPQRSAKIKAAEDYARDILGVTYADYTGIDPAIADEWNTHLERTLKEIPELKGKIKFIGSTEAQNKLMEPILEKIRLEKALRKFPKASEEEIKKIVVEYKEADLKILMKENVIARTINPNDERLKPFLGIAINPKAGWNKAVLEKKINLEISEGRLPPGTASVKAAFDHEVAHLLDHFLGLRNDLEIVTFWESYVIGRKALGLVEITKEEFIANSWTEYHNNPQREGLPKQLSSLIINKYRLRYG
jgi:hypothetical protein